MKINYVKPELEYKNGESYLKLIANIQEGDKKYQADIEGIELEKLSIIKEDGIAKYIQFPLSNYKGEVKLMCFDDNDNKWIDKIEECIIKENDSMKVLEEKLNEIIKHIYLAQGVEIKSTNTNNTPKEQLVKYNVSDVIINLDGKEEIIDTVGSQILDVNYNRTLFAIEFYGEFDVLNNIIEESNKGNYIEFKVTKRDIYSNTDCQFVKEDKEELGSMGLVKYYSHKICDNPGYNCKHIVVFGKSADWYSIKEDEIRYLIDRLNNK